MRRPASDRIGPFPSGQRRWNGMAYCVRPLKNCLLTISPSILCAIIFCAALLTVPVSCGKDDTAPEDEARSPREVGRASKPDWHPDGTYITGTYGGAYDYKFDWIPAYMRIWEIDNLQAKLHRNVELSEKSVSFHAWSHDASDPRLIIAERDEDTGDRLTRLDDLEGEPGQIYNAPGQIRWPSWTSDNGRIAFISGEEADGVLLIPADGSGEPSLIDNDLGWGSVVFARCSGLDESLIYVSSYDGQQNVYRIGLDGGTPERLTNYEREPVVIYCAEIRPDGSSVAYSLSGQESMYPAIFEQPIDGGQPNKLTSSIIDSGGQWYRSWFYFAWSPEGDRIAAEVKDVNTGGGIIAQDRAVYVVPVD